jgi:hypothetical protein
MVRTKATERTRVGKMTERTWMGKLTKKEACTQLRKQINKLLPLWVDISIGDTESAIAKFEKGEVGINESTPLSMNPLEMAIDTNNTTLIKYLIDNGAEKKVTVSDEQRALYKECTDFIINEIQTYSANLKK